MELSDLFLAFFIVLLGLGAFSVFLGQFFSEEKCTGCGRFGPSRHMSKDTRGRHWHYSCYKDGYFFE